MRKITQASTLAALLVTTLAMSGCGEDTTTSTPPVAAAPSIYTASYMWDTNNTVQFIGGGAILTDDNTTLNGATEVNIWKGDINSLNAIAVDDVNYTGAGYASSPVTVTSDINASVTWSTGDVVSLTGAINVLSGVTLTIQPGVVIYGKTPSTYLAVNTGATIDANGTQAQPIIFTSEADFNGTSTLDAKGEWGGLVLLGNAYTHAGVKTYEAGTQSYGSTTTANNTESSGVLNYVAIKHSGFEVEVGKELNGLSLAGVGSGTSITNIAIIGGADDGMEIWGGTVNLTGLYVYNASDDSVDVDLGYRGTITDVLVQQKIVDKTTFDSSTIEAGNDSNTYNVNATTATLPTIVNGTFYGVGGSVYMKNDAGIVYNNVKLQLNNTATPTQEMIKHRTADVVSTNAVFVDTGKVSLKNLQDVTKLYATVNAKD